MRSRIKKMGDSTDAPAYDVVWGPVEKEIGEKYGALAGCKSILVRPVDACGEWRSIMERVRALIPKALLPCADDDTTSLVRRLAASDFLDDIHVLRGGCGPQRVRLNATAYPQPRRVTWSVKAEEEEADAYEGCVPLYAYTQYGRLPEDWRCRLMPPDVRALMHSAHNLARATGQLSPQCAASTPTACQLMMYYTAFKSSVGRHRDNFCKEHLVQYCSGVDLLNEMTSGHSASGDQNSQILGSDVLLWTDGNAPMSLMLSFPDPEKSVDQDRKEYIICPSFCIPMGAGTLLIFKAIDDLLFCHEAAFGDMWLDFHGDGGYRFVYVFRWLQSVRRFSVEPPYSMIVPPELKAKLEENRAASKRKRTRDNSWRPGI